MNPTRKSPTTRAILSLSLSLDELTAIDAAAARKQLSRSAFIREAARRAAQTVLRKLDGERLAA